MGLTIPQFRRSPNQLATALGLTPQSLRESIEKLKKMKIVSEENEKITVLQDNFHLSKSSPLYGAWKLALRTLLLQRTQPEHLERDYSFSVVFSADSDTKRTLMQKWFEYLKEMEKTVAESKENELYQVNFDFHSLTNAMSLPNGPERSH